MRDPEDPVGVLVEIVVAQLVPDEEQDEDAAGQAQGQTEHLDGGVSEMPLDVPDGDEKVVFQHDGSPENGMPDEPRHTLENLENVPNDAGKSAFGFGDLGIFFLEVPGSGVPPTPGKDPDQASGQEFGRLDSGLHDVDSSGTIWGWPSHMVSWTRRASARAFRPYRLSV